MEFNQHSLKKNLTTNQNEILPVGLVPHGMLKNINKFEKSELLKYINSINNYNNTNILNVRVIIF